MNDITRNDVIEHPLFTPFRSDAECMHATNLFTISDVEYRIRLRAKFLADAIPATSFATGANETGGVHKNYDMQSQPVSGWPRRMDNHDVWFHSDMKDMAYRHVFPLYKNLIETLR